MAAGPWRTSLFQLGQPRLWHHLPPLPSGTTGTGPARGSLLGRSREPLPSQPEHDPEDRVGVALRRLCSLSPSACREVALLKARTSRRGLFLTQGRPTGCEPVSSRTDQTKRSTSQANGALCASSDLISECLFGGSFTGSCRFWEYRHEGFCP